MSNPPFFSVIIPTHNRQEVVLRAIASVLAQTFKNYELIIVDDGSQDQTSLAVQKYLKKGVRYLRLSQRQGVSFARNYGATQARGQYLAFLDSDDEWLPSKLARQFQFLQENLHLKLIHCDEIWIRNGVRVNPMKKHQKKGGVIYLDCLPLCCISPSAVVIEKNCFFKLGGFREDFAVCEDYDLWLKICSRYEVGFISEPLLKKYGGHQDQLSRKYFGMDEWRVRALVYILENQNLCPQWHTQTLLELRRKITILIKGYQKRGKDKEVTRLKKLWQRVAIQNFMGEIAL